MNKLIITAAICGAEVTKADNPNVPYTVDEIAREAKSAVDAGASVIHLHVRDDDGVPTQSAERFAKCFTAIREACGYDVIIQPSTGGAVGMSDDERLAPLSLKPEFATLDCGTLNFGDSDIFVNTIKTVRCFAARMRELNIKPELEVFDRGMIDTALLISKEGHINRPLHFNFVLGVKGGIGAGVDSLAFMAGAIPADATYTVSGVGKYQLPMAAASIAFGGHARVGFEDNIFLKKGVKAGSNGELVRKAAEVAQAIGREIATPEEARKILNIK